MTYTTPADFERAIAALSKPIKPQCPTSVIKENNYSDKSGYYSALSEAYRVYEKELRDYINQQNEYSESIKQIRYQFKDFCMKRFCVDGISEETKSKIFSTAYLSNNKRFQDTYDAVGNLSEIANNAFKDGIVSTLDLIVKS